MMTSMNAYPGVGGPHWKPLYNTKSAIFVNTHFLLKCIGQCTFQLVPKRLAAIEHHRQGYPNRFQLKYANKRSEYKCFNSDIFKVSFFRSQENGQSCRTPDQMDCQSSLPQTNEPKLARTIGRRVRRLKFTTAGKKLRNKNCDKLASFWRYEIEVQEPWKLLVLPNQVNFVISSNIFELILNLFCLERREVSFAYARSLVWMSHRRTEHPATTGTRPAAFRPYVGAASADADRRTDGHVARKQESQQEEQRAFSSVDDCHRWRKHFKLQSI